jgi:hypothetical protein
MGKEYVKDEGERNGCWRIGASVGTLNKYTGWAG